MISQKYQKTLLHRKFTANVLTESAESIFKEQAAVAKTYIHRKSGDLVAKLQSRPFTVVPSGSGAILTLEYLKYTRFVDMKKTPRGKRKKNYHALYNKIFYGTIYGYTYNALRYGLTGAVREEIFDTLRKSYAKGL